MPNFQEEVEQLPGQKWLSLWGKSGSISARLVLPPHLGPISQQIEVAAPRAYIQTCIHTYSTFIDVLSYLKTAMRSVLNPMRLALNPMRSVRNGYEVGA